MPSREMDPTQWVDAETACAMLEIAPRTLRHLAAEDKIMRVVRGSSWQGAARFVPAASWHLARAGDFGEGEVR